MNQKKSLKELNLLDKFLFDEAMDDPENNVGYYTESEDKIEASTTDRERTENIYR